MKTNWYNVIAISSVTGDVNNFLFVNLSHRGWRLMYPHGYFQRYPSAPTLKSGQSRVLNLLSKTYNQPFHHCQICIQRSSHSFEEITKSVVLMAFTQTVARVSSKFRRNVGQTGLNSMLSRNQGPTKLMIRISQSHCVKKTINRFLVLHPLFARL